MTDPLLPDTIPAATAALIAGLSAATFKARCLETELVKCDGHRVVLASLSAYLGKEIDAETYLAAERRRDAARDYQNKYRNRNH
jgi:hypothetical protein